MRTVTKPLIVPSFVVMKVGRTELSRIYSCSESSCPNHIGKLRRIRSHASSIFDVARRALSAELATMKPSSSYLRNGSIRKILHQPDPSNQLQTSDAHKEVGATVYEYAQGASLARSIPQVPQGRQSRQNSGARSACRRTKSRRRHAPGVSALGTTSAESSHKHPARSRRGWIRSHNPKQISMAIERFGRESPNPRSESRSTGESHDSHGCRTTR